MTVGVIRNILVFILLLLIIHFLVRLVKEVRSLLRTSRPEPPHAEGPPPDVRDAKFVEFPRSEKPPDDTKEP